MDIQIKRCAYFKAHFRRLSGETEENMEKQSGRTVQQLRFKLGTRQIQGAVTAEIICLENMRD
jgi:molybdopterin converting factor small subunit